MTLMSCPACRRAVSDNARLCPYCGGTVAAEAKTQSAGGESPVIRPARRQLKKQLAVAVAIFWAGIALAALAPSSVTSSSEPSSMLTLFMPLITTALIFAGVLGYVVTKLRIRYLK